MFIYMSHPSTADDGDVSCQVGREVMAGERIALSTLSHSYTEAGRQGQ